VRFTAPVSTTGPLKFEGFWSNMAGVQPGGKVAIFTAWRVTRLTEEPLSIMAHLLNSQGLLISGSDGLAVPTEMWQTGDTIIQAHWLDIPQNLASGDYWIETGVYRLDTLERYRILKDNQAVGDRLILASINPK
jgi:hypothetical protein